MTVRLFPLAGLRPAFARSQPALGQPLDAGEKAIVAERVADAFGRSLAGPNASSYVELTARYPRILRFRVPSMTDYLLPSVPDCGTPQIQSVPSGEIVRPRRRWSPPRVILQTSHMSSAEKVPYSSDTGTPIFTVFGPS